MHRMSGASTGKMILRVHARDGRDNRFRQAPDHVVGPSTLSDFDFASQIEACFSRQCFVPVRSRNAVRRGRLRLIASRRCALSWPAPDVRLFWSGFSRTSFMMCTSLWWEDRCRESATPTPLARWYRSWYGFGAQAESAIITMRTQSH